MAVSNYNWIVYPTTNFVAHLGGYTSGLPSEETVARTSKEVKTSKKNNYA